MRFSIITPSLNSERFIRETIESVISQSGKFSIEYFIMDGGSVDGTQEIVQQYQKKLSEKSYPIQCDEVLVHWFSEEDNGMYDAIKKGFTRTTGDIYAWINADDIYFPGAFDIIQRTIEKYPEISWLKGITSYINENSTVYAAGCCNLYRQDLIRAGLYGPILNFIQQDSVFWRAELWNKSGGLDAQLTLAGDFFLWQSFSKLVPLYSLNAYVSCFRKVPDQKSADMKAYFKEIDQYFELDVHLAKKINRCYKYIKYLPKAFRPIFQRLIFGSHDCYLIRLKDNVAPDLIESEYFLLKDMV